MPIHCTFTWTEDEDCVCFVVKLPAVKAKVVDIVVCPLYLKINQQPYFWEADLKAEVDPDDSKSYTRVSNDKITINLRKRQSGLWKDFRYHVSEKDFLRYRKAEEVAEKKPAAIGDSKAITDGTPDSKDETLHPKEGTDSDSTKALTDTDSSKDEGSDRPVPPKWAKPVLVVRRKKALAEWEEKQKQKIAERDTKNHQLLKAAEEEQWRLDREARQKLEIWKQQEQKVAEDEVFAVLDNLDGTEQKVERRVESPKQTARQAKPPKQSQSPEQKSQTEKKKYQPLTGYVGDADMERTKKGFRKVQIDSESDDSNDDESYAAKLKKKGEALAREAGVVYEESDEEKEEEQEEEEEELAVIEAPTKRLPEPRQKAQKMVLPMTRHAKPGVPARDRPGRAPPHPRDMSGMPAKPIPRLEGEIDPDEEDPVWLKDKADKCMANGEYQTAHEAYTKCLQDYSNARAFANRALASMYLGDLGAVVEDCNHAIKILNHKLKVPEGHCPPPRDPEDERVRARVLIRKGTAQLWLGDFSGCEASYSSALNDTEYDCALDVDERKIVIEDLNRVRRAADACMQKSELDKQLRKVSTKADILQNKIIDQYNAVFAIEEERNAVIAANRGFCKLQAQDYPGSLEDCSKCIDLLGHWPAPRRPPAPVQITQRVDPPTLEDHTFRNPVAATAQNREGKMDDRDWLMKHSGGDGHALPEIPDDFEWVRDASEKNDESWIAVRKKLTRAQVDSIRMKIHKFQEALYTRQLGPIDEAIEVATQQNMANDGPSNEAIRQAREFREKLANHFKEQEEKKKDKEQEAQKEWDTSAAWFEKNLEFRPGGRSLPGTFSRQHPCEKTKRRLYVKTRLREAKAFEELEEWEDASGSIDKVLSVEPRNPDALAVKKKIDDKIRAEFKAKNTGDVTMAHAGIPEDPEAAKESADKIKKLIKEKVISKSPIKKGDHKILEADKQAAKKDVNTLLDDDLTKDDDDDDDEEEGVTTRADIKNLIATGMQYLEKSEFENAHQIFSYAMKHVEKDSTFPAMESLRVRLNMCLCLQKSKRAQDLVASCGRAMTAIGGLRKQLEVDDADQVALKRFEAAALTRRSWAYNQMNRKQEATVDAKKAQELLKSVK